ncbi:hypothetical protein [Taibaiella soli]|uniref:Uncharacterized protein n=1 Tax=Taibaiella soli TaxID=1649169 RepID=A0A2W2BYL2_9BACT|nr:hypothetical protein [Taibaiella soli]PZF72963.1 hypothetical protein DN068_11165 [Taibaiella soli]
MKFSNLHIAVATAMLVSFTACQSGVNKSHGPIVIGDSSTIVTEADSKYLEDFVTDIQPKTPDTATVSTETTTPKDTVQAAPKEQPKQQEPVTQAPKGNGLTVEFKDVTVFIPGVSSKSGNSKHNGNSAAYGLSGGELNGSQLQISGGTVQKLTQRYTTSVILDGDLGTFVLEQLNHTSSWTPLKGNGSNYYITGLDDRHLEHSNASANAIRSAVQRAAKAKRLSRKKENELLNSVRNVKAVNQKPLEVVLRTVVWQIEGKDAKGKSFRKELRIDMPI